MNTEYEVKILDIDPESIKSKLESIGAKFVADYHFRRYIFDIIPAEKSKWVRLRTDGNTSTLTYKNSENDAIDGMKEVEVVVSDFNATRNILEAAGFKPVSYQENKRELYKLNGVEISIDEWPHIPPYVEIEGKHHADVSETLKILGLSNNKQSSLPTDAIYKIYGKSIKDYNPLVFDK